MLAFGQLPDAGILLPPAVRAFVGERGEDARSVSVEHVAIAHEQRRHFEDVAVNAVLVLVGGEIARHHRPRRTIAVGTSSSLMGGTGPPASV